MTVKPSVTFTCEACGAKFKVKQGSRRKFCGACTMARILGGRKIKK